MLKEFSKFCIDKIENKKFHFSKNPIGTNDVNINKIIISDASLK